MNQVSVNGFLFLGILLLKASGSTSSIAGNIAKSYAKNTASLYNRYASVNNQWIVSNEINPRDLEDDNTRLRRRLARSETENEEPVVIDAFFHILIANETEGDDVDNATIEKQLQILNEAFGGETNSFYTDCYGNPATSLKTGFRFRQGGPSTRTALSALDDPSFHATIMEEERSTLFFLLEQGRVVDDIEAFEDFYYNQTIEEQILTLANAPNAGLTLIPFLLGKKIREDSNSTESDGCDKLHIYIQPGIITPVYGYAQEPWSCRQTNENRLMDGVFLHRATLPDSDFTTPNHNAMLAFTPAEGELAWANQGDTLVHEVGHWLGLTHTFAGATVNTTTGCDFFGGDKILDTPAQEMGSSSYCIEHPCCNMEADSCPHIPGFDPVWNFMDYSDDCCMVRFTEMQAERMKHSWTLFREAEITEHSYDSSRTEFSSDAETFASRNLGDICMVPIALAFLMFVLH